MMNSAWQSTDQHHQALISIVKQQSTNFDENAEQKGSMLFMLMLNMLICANLC
jgi:hypothetical protein